MKKGDIVWLVDTTWNNKTHCRHAEIATCGPKWITLVGDKGRRFYKERLVDSYNGSSRIYATKEEHDLDVERGNLASTCRNKFSYGSVGNLSLDQLRRIDAILKESKA